MTSLEYMQKKNKLVKRVTGKVLIPNDQLKNVRYSREFKPSISLKDINCPYCVFYDSCSDCPMSRAGNNCNSIDSTFSVVNRIWQDVSTRDDRNELFKLGLKYKRSNE